MENLFESVKAAVTMPEVVQHYGFSPNRAGFINCPFHAEKTASLKVYPDSFYCFGCGAAGSVIDFVMRLYCISPIESAKKINNDMRLGLQVDSEPGKNEVDELQQAKESQELFEPFVERYKSELCALIYRANIIEKGLSDLDELSKAEAKALRFRERAEYLLDTLNNGSLEDKIAVIKSREEVEDICSQIIEGWKTQ